MEPQTWSVRLGLVEGALAIADRVNTQGDPDALHGSRSTADQSLGFAEFYSVHHGTIARALALTLGDTQLGVEATDEAMTRAYQRWYTVRQYNNAPRWVYRVGLNWARSFHRRSRRSVSSPFVETRSSVDPSPGDPALAAALASLAPKHRSVVVLRYLLDWSVEQTADALEIAPGTVKSRLHRALNQLEAQLGAQENQ